MALHGASAASAQVAVASSAQAKAKRSRVETPEQEILAAVKEELSGNKAEVKQAFLNGLDQCLASGNEGNPKFTTLDLALQAIRPKIAAFMRKSLFAEQIAAFGAEHTEGMNATVETEIKRDPLIVHLKDSILIRNGKRACEALEKLGEGLEKKLMTYIQDSCRFMRGNRQFHHLSEFKAELVDTCVAKFRDEFASIERDCMSDFLSDDANAAFKVTNILNMDKQLKGQLLAKRNSGGNLLLNSVLDSVSSEGFIIKADVGGQLGFDFGADGDSFDFC